MSTHVGLAVARDALRAVAVRRGRIVWAGEAPLDGGEGGVLEDAIGALLAEAPLPRWPRPLLSAAVGPHASQIKLVGGLPDIGDAATLSAVVREGVGSFFLKNGVPLVTTGVRPAGPAVAMAAALDLPCVEAIRNACRARGWRLAQIAPAAVALPLALEDEHLVWTDGVIVLEIARTGPTINAVRSRPRCTVEGADIPAHPVPGLASLGENAVRYADAYGAAALPATEPLALDALTAGLLSRSELWRPFIVPLLLGAAAIASLILSPLAARWAAARADARVAAVRPGRWQVIVTALGQIDRATRILDEAGAFAASRSTVTDVLGELTRALPDGAALASLELDGDRGQLEALTQQPTDVLAAIKRVRSVASAELVGAPRPEPVAGRELQRVMVRFRLARGSR
jgi:hypothetical protein